MKCEHAYLPCYDPTRTTCTQKPWRCKTRRLLSRGLTYEQIMKGIYIRPDLVKKVWKRRGLNDERPE